MTPEKFIKISILEKRANDVFELSQEIARDLDNIESEGDVETKFIQPLLKIFGYSGRELRSKRSHKTPKDISKLGKSYIPDFELFGDTLGFILDAKEPNEKLENWKTKIQNYISAFNTKTPQNAPYMIFGVLANNKEIIIYKKEGEKVFSTKINDLGKNLKQCLNLVSFLSREMIDFPKDEGILGRPFNSEHEIKKVIWTIQNAYRSAGLLNTFQQLNEIVILLLIKHYEEERFYKNGHDIENYRLLALNLERNAPADEEDSLYNYLNGTLLKEVKKHYRSSGLFEENDKLGGFGIKLSREILLNIIRILNVYSLSETKIDYRGSAFQSILRDTMRGDAGQYFTPTNITEFLVKAIVNTYNMRIFDPACGTGGFLISAYRNAKSILENKKQNGEMSQTIYDDELEKLQNEYLKGYDIDPIVARIARMNFILWGDGSTGITRTSTITENFTEEYDIIFSNPPFGSPERDSSVLEELGFGGFKNAPLQVLFLSKFHQMLKAGGRLGVVLPESIFENSGELYNKAQKIFFDNFIIEAIIDLPEEAFVAYKSAQKTILLIARKKIDVSDKQGPVFIATPTDIGIDRRGRYVPEEDYLLSGTFDYFREFIKRPVNENKVYFADKKLVCMKISSTDFLKAKRFNPWFFTKDLFTKDIKKDFPAGTELIKLGSIADIINKSERKINKKNLPLFDKIFYVEIRDVNSNIGLIVKYEKVEEPSNLPTAAKQELDLNDLLISTVRPLNGGVAIVDWKPKNKSIIIGTEGFAILKLKKDSKVTLPYLLALLRFDFCRYQLHGYTSSPGGYPKIMSKEDILKIDIPLFPQNERKKIHNDMLKVIECMKEIRDINKGIFNISK